MIILSDFFQFFSQLEQRRLIDYLTEERHRWSLIIVSTAPIIVSRCTKVVLLKQGQKVAEGTYEEVKEEPFFQELIFGELTSP